jgi:hypothetical protein
MTRKAAPRGAGKRPLSAPPPLKAPIPKAAAASVAPGRLTKMAAKVNSQVTHIASAKSTKPTPRTRRNKKGLLLYVEPAVTIALRRLALDTGASVQTLGMAALNLLFKEHGRSQFPVYAETSS